MKYREKYYEIYVDGELIKDALGQNNAVREAELIKETNKGLKVEVYEVALYEELIYG